MAFASDESPIWPTRSKYNEGVRAQQPYLLWTLGLKFLWTLGLKFPVKGPLPSWGIPGRKQPINLTYLGVVCYGFEDLRHSVLGGYVYTCAYLCIYVHM